MSVRVAIGCSGLRTVTCPGTLQSAAVTFFTPFEEIVTVCASSARILNLTRLRLSSNITTSSFIPSID